MIINFTGTPFSFDWGPYQGCLKRATCTKNGLMASRGRLSPAKELTLRPAVAPANVCRAPREAMGLTELLLLELGEDPVTRNPSVKLEPTHASHANRNQSTRVIDTTQVLSS